MPSTKNPGFLWFPPKIRNALSKIRGFNMFPLKIKNFYEFPLKNPVLPCFPPQKSRISMGSL
jgi:hypothetical protein